MSYEMEMDYLLARIRLDRLKIENLKFKAKMQKVGKIVK